MRLHYLYYYTKNNLWRHWHGQTSWCCFLTWARRWIGEKGVLLQTNTQPTYLYFPRWPACCTLRGLFHQFHCVAALQWAYTAVHSGSNVARLPYFATVFFLFFFLGLNIYCSIRQFKGDLWVWILNGMNLQEQQTTLMAFYVRFTTQLFLFSPLTRSRSGTVPASADHASDSATKYRQDISKCRKSSSVWSPPLFFWKWFIQAASKCEQFPFPPLSLFLSLCLCSLLIMTSAEPFDPGAIDGLAPWTLRGDTRRSRDPPETRRPPDFPGAPQQRLIGWPFNWSATRPLLHLNPPHLPLSPLRKIRLVWALRPKNIGC